MQIKNTNYQISQPNFQARYLSRSVSTAAKNRAESVIDIYSLNKNDKNFILDELKQRLTLKDRILMHFFKDYTYRIYIKGIKKGYDWDF